MRWAGVAGVALIVVASSLLALSEPLSRTHHAFSLTSPISMSPGRVSTGEFGVDVSEPYQIGIDFKKPNAIPSDTLDCLVGLAQWEPQVNCGATHPVVNVKWSLYSGGSVVGRGSSEGGNGYWLVGPALNIGGFRGKEGHRYALDVDILTDGSQLAPAEPQLRVANPEYDEDRIIGRFFVRIITVSFVLLGVTLIVLSFARKPRSN